jgi:hypothetical protein
MSDLRPLGPEARAAIVAELGAPGADPAARRRLRDRLWTALAIAPVIPAIPPAALQTGAAAQSAAAGAGHAALTTSGRLLALFARYPGPVVAASLTVGGLGGVAIHAQLAERLTRPPTSIGTKKSHGSVPMAPLPQNPQSPASALDIVPWASPQPQGNILPTTPARPASALRSDVHRIAPVPTHEAAPAPTVAATVPEPAAEQTAAPAAPTEPPLVGKADEPARDSEEDESPLALEAALLERARTALARGWVEPAVVALEQHRQSFPDGQLVEEREALSIMASARAGVSPDAASRVADFERRFPHSLWREQVESTLPSR